MSHFALMVVGDDPEAAMAPFQENNMGDCPQEYLEFVDCEDELREDWEKDTTEKVVMPDGRLLWSFDEAFRVPGTFGTGSKTHKVPEGLEIRTFTMKELYPVFEDYCTNYHGYESRDGRTARYGRWENPNKKWDWFELGGRYKNRLATKDGRVGNSFLRGELDFAAMKRAREASFEFKWADFGDRIRVDIEAGMAKEKADEKWRSIYDIPKGVGHDEYVASAPAFSAFAVLKDGEWHKRGEMGWWGCFSDEKSKDEWDAEFAKLVDGLPDDALISIYDCHI